MMGLVACSHANPLKEHSNEESIKFLTEASSYAAQKMNYRIGFVKDVYGYCVLGDMNEDPEFCPNFYENMLEYAKNTHTDFSHITLKDLEDKNYFEPISREYFLYGRGTVKVNGKEI